MCKHKIRQHPVKYLPIVFKMFDSMNSRSSSVYKYLTPHRSAIRIRKVAPQELEIEKMSKQGMMWQNRPCPILWLFEFRIMIVKWDRYNSIVSSTAWESVWFFRYDMICYRFQGMISWFFYIYSCYLFFHI